MFDIMHRVGIENVSADEVYAALTTVDGLSRWWTVDTTGRPDGVGGVVEFRFDGDGFDMRVVELVPGALVRWEVIGGPEEWIGTRVHWQIDSVDGYTIVRFEHLGWREPVEFMYHCSTKWAVFLMSLKSMLETGTGAPAPQDVAIGDWR